jgi:hypothetical protein
MPAWSPALNKEQIALLADYIAANANKSWRQRRPLQHPLQPASRHQPAGRLQAAEGLPHQRLC